ncbi:MAG: PAS domain S-box protein, partial [Cytophagaceae bacterium]
SQMASLVARATNDAIWDWDLATGHVRWNESMAQVFRIAPEHVLPTADWWVDNIHPADRDRIVHDIHEVIDGADSTWTDEYRFRRGDGTYAVALDRGYVLRDASGKALRMIGSFVDITNEIWKLSIIETMLPTV